MAVLNSWKVISAYTGKGIRTLQRWEATSELPVHRPNGHSRSAVFALSEEVDQWLRSRPTGAHDNKENPTQDGIDFAAVRARAHELLAKGDAAYVLMQEVQNNMRLVMAKAEKYRKQPSPH